MKKKTFFLCFTGLAIFAIIVYYAALTWHRYYRFQASGTLPVIHIDTKDREPINSNKDYLMAECYIDANGIKGYESMGNKSQPIPLQIRGRGNSTWTNYIKKPYRLKFDERQAPLGLSPCKHFALLAHADDSIGFLRDALGFEIARKMDFKFTPREVPCELYLNGRYQGLYFLAENIIIDKNRLNIKKQENKETNPQNVPYGWLIEFDNYSDSPHITSEEPFAYEFAVTYHTPKKLSDVQESYLTQSIHEIMSAIYEPDKENFAVGNYLDINQLVQFYVLSESIGDIEAFIGSLYFHKDKGEEKWVCGPVWDFGQAIETRLPTNKFIWENTSYEPTFICELVKFPEFMHQVREYWPTFYQEIYPTLNQFIDDYAAHIMEGAKADYARWPQYGNKNVLERAEFAKQFLRERTEFLQSQWGNQ